MSDRTPDTKANADTVVFVPVAHPAAAEPGSARLRPAAVLPWYGRRPVLALMFGVLLPLAAIVVEAVTRVCAQTFFDPIPTWWHAAAIALVPLANLRLLILTWPQRSAATPAPSPAPSPPAPPSPTPSPLAMPDARLSRFVAGVALGVSLLWTLLFLPLLPLSLAAVTVPPFMFLAVLPWAPLAGLISGLVLLRRLPRRPPLTAAGPQPRRWLSARAGVVVGLLAVIGLDVQPAVTRLGLAWATDPDAAVEARGIALLRTLGSESLIRQHSYDSRTTPTGLLTAAIAVVTRQPDVAAAVAARTVYWRVYGRPFNTEPPPLAAIVPFPRAWNPIGAATWDSDHGGTSVGGRIRGLDLVASRLDGSIAADEAVAYLEWTSEYRNTSEIDREVRLEIALPPGAVVSRATLWVAGEEREAAYAGRAQARAAYEAVAVRQRRDPLLVTTKGPDRILAQAFPVPPGGGTIKFKLGITAPLDVAAADPVTGGAAAPEASTEARLVLPAVVDRNFTVGPDVRHAVWIESRGAVSARIDGLTVAADGLRLTGEVADRTLSTTRQVVTVARRPDAPTRTLSTLAGAGTIAQEIAQVSTRVGDEAPLLIVLDGSMAAAPVREALRDRIRTLPEPLPVGLVVAGDRTLTMPPATGAAHRAALADALAAVTFVGGQDNGPALTEALRLGATRAGATVLWVHGPQPVVFPASRLALEQAIERLPTRPRLRLYPVAPGALETLPDVPWTWTASTLAATGDRAADLRRATADLAGTATIVNRTRVASEAPVAGAAEGPPPAEATSTGVVSTGVVSAGSGHVARLWARDDIIRRMVADPLAHREAAVALAGTLALVTPVSGAVVLETKAQYDAAGLTPKGSVPGTLPTIPEPHEWALMFVAAMLLAIALQRRRQTRYGRATRPR